MSEEETIQHQAPLPDSLRNQLEKFRKHLWRIKITEAILAGLIGLVFSFALVFALDRLWEMPAMLRLIILLAGISLFAVFAPLWINRWVFRHRKENQLARLISKHYPKLGDRLLGVVELQDQDESKTALSPKLREAAMIAVAHESKKRDLEKAVPKTWLPKLGAGFAVLFAGSAVAFFVFPNAGLNALKRWLMPLSDTERYTFTKMDLSHIPNPYYVARDEPFEIVAKFQDDTESKPDTLEARFGNGSWNTFSLQDNSYTIKFDKGVRNRGEIDIKVGDANESIAVYPVERSNIRQSKAIITYPDYIGREPVTQEFGSGEIEALEGSKVVVQSHADRDLSKVSAGPMKIEPVEERVLTEEDEIELGGADPKPIEPKYIDLAATAKDSIITTDTITVGEDTISFPIKWVDQYGIKGNSELNLKINPRKDELPMTYAQNTPKERFMLYTEVLELDLVAEDDFGLKAAGIEWQGEFITPTPGEPAKGEEQFVKGSHTKESIRQKIHFDFNHRGIGPQKITIRTWTQDYHPDHKRVYSEPIVIYLLSKAEHADHQKNRLDNAMSDLESAMRNEQDNLDENERIQKDLKSGDPKKVQEAKDKLQKQQDKELENKDAIDKIAKEMKDILKESAKNDTIDPKTMKDMADSAQKLDKMGKQDIPKVAEKLGDAQNKKNSQQKTEQDLQDAIEKQKEVLEEMKETVAKANQAKKKLEAGTFVNRLKRAAEEEESIAQNLLSQAAHFLGGYEYEDLDPAIKRLAQQLYLQQKQTSSDILWIQEDLHSFHARTQKEAHKKLIEAMLETDLDGDMKELEQELSRPKGNEAKKGAKALAAQLREWAKQLEGVKEDDQAGGGGGGGGGGGSQEDQDFEFMLKVMQMIQKEQELRARTRALEQQRRNFNGTEKP